MDFQQRLLPKKLAARYCGQPPERFVHVCPAKPIKLTESDHPKWDIKDLDKWIGAVKANGNSKSREEWLELL